MSLGIEVLKKELEITQEKAKIEAEKLYKAQIQYRRNEIAIFEKISLFSAGIISLSITFLGYILSQDKQILKTSVKLISFKIPIYLFLYFSWCFFVLSLIIGFLIKKYDSLYLLQVSQEDYCKSMKKFTEKKIKFFDEYSNVIWEQGTNKETETNKEINNINIVDDFLKKNIGEKYFFIVKDLQRCSIFFFIIGILFLLFFAMEYMYQLIIFT